MTLRLRLVIAIAAMVTAGLAVFGVTTYTLYARTEYRRLDDRLVGSASFFTRQLARPAGFGPSEGGPGHGGPDGDRGPPGGPPAEVPPYADLRDRSGAVVRNEQLSSSAQRPRLPSHVRAGSTD